MRVEVHKVSSTKTWRVWRWAIRLDRGGQETPWPWLSLTISRRNPKGGS